MGKTKRQPNTRHWYSWSLKCSIECEVEWETKCPKGESYDEIVERVTKKWIHRNETDNRYSTNIANKYFKRLNKRTVRKAGKDMIRSYMKYGDYDKPTPGDYMGKKHIWSVW